MFCVECGKDTPIFKDGVCVDCYLGSHQFTSGPEICDLETCPHCGSYKYKSNWVQEILPDFLIKWIKNNFKISKELEKIDINPVCKETKQGIFCKVYISGKIKDVEISEDHDLLVRQKNNVCDVCSKRFGGYHEAIIQVRPEKNKMTSSELNNFQKEVEDLVAEQQAKGNNYY